MNVRDEICRTIGPDRIICAGSFAPNGSSNPDPTASRGRTHGFTFVVTYAATGIFTVTLPEGYTLPEQPLCIAVFPQASALANWFDAIVVGETTLNTTTRQFVIQAHRAGVANAPAANAGTRINFLLYVSNNTGR